MNTDQAPIERAVKIAGGTVSLARLLNVQPPTVSGWVKRTRPVPAERCLEIEAATNHQVRCEALRPDVRWDVMFKRPEVHVGSLDASQLQVDPNERSAVV
ncbi:helix-turn-helix domain-containing protein [Nostoc sp. NIES-2111]